MKQRTLAMMTGFEQYTRKTRRAIFLEEMEQVNLHLQAKGVRITTGTIVDATILHAPTSTKNREQQRDPEMHQTKKGKQWCVSRTRAQARDAVPKMGDGLPESAYRSRLQTARCCCVQKAWW